MRRARPPSLHRLARAFGVQTAYYGLGGRRQQADPDALITILRLLGAEIDTTRDVGAAYRVRTAQLWAQVLKPVTVIDISRTIEGQLPSSPRPGRLRCNLALENGQMITWDADWTQLPLTEQARIDGVVYQRRRMTLPEPIPPGYHCLRIESAHRQAETFLIVAPARARTTRGQAWGIFAPAYALHSDHSWGMGDVGDLERLGHWAASLGGRFVATTPMLATYNDADFDPSPYAPISRLFWNELYVNLDQIPELEDVSTPRSLTASPEFQAELAMVRRSPTSDYARLGRLKQSALSALSDVFFEHPTELRADFDCFVAANPRLRRYARFQAIRELLQAPWREWPEPLRSGRLDSTPTEQRTERYHLYAQWLMERQLAAAASHLTNQRCTMYFDLPIGARRDGFDAWDEQQLFVSEASIGAPPDPGFPSGQNWGLPPIHPEASQAQGHRYFIDSLRHQMRHAGLLRIDHVMGLHRLFWIPPGADSRDGVYVNYPADEYYAILRLESHRQQCVVVGEDLGTVPRKVRGEMGRSGIQRLYVLQLDLLNPRSPLGEPPAASVASLNTHDMPPFAGALRQSGGAEGWRRLVAVLRRRGFLRSDDLEEPDEQTILGACITMLAESRARNLLINLEDLWLETEPQNIPGDTSEANWRRRTRLPIEEIELLMEARDLLEAVSQLRTAVPTPNRPPAHPQL
ncbi:MAG: 4-alpha-glucanotransferase [Chloroflexi bacterium]|nr:4-alpha-glucanotransferase [Chloroflexota bacterium]